ncbi:hypothetical protein T484DRAFT_1798902 [Baffinella frigidus]|nr:hypothetical protein T484DRAFT_1798902 [Cryptophyta sp. CCMP2293]
MGSSTLLLSPQSTPPAATPLAAASPPPPPPPPRVEAPGPSAYDLLPGIVVSGEEREAGRGCFATRNFAAGEVVFSEEPIALLPPNALAIERYRTFASCSAAARGKMLDMALPADEKLLPGAELDPSNTAAAWVGQARASVDAALATHPELSPVGSELLMKVHLAWTFNAYAFRPTGAPAGDAPHSAMFAVGSKVNHACLPVANLTYSSGHHFQPPPAVGVPNPTPVAGVPLLPAPLTRGTWTALRDIPEGAELLVSYLDTSSPENSALLSAHARRR